VVEVKKVQSPAKKIQKNAIGGIEKGLILPTSVSTPSDRMEDYSLLLYGDKKIGKTSLASQFSDALFFFLEPGGKALSVKEVHPKNWSQILGYTTLLENDSTFHQIVIDTCDIAYELCMEHVCKKMGIDHPGDEDFGKGWKAVKDEFSAWVRRILNMQKGAILISHSKTVEVKSRMGTKFNRVIPTLAKQAEDVIAGLTDMWYYYTYVGSERVLILEGDDLISAGRRLENSHFHTPDGKRLSMIHMGSSSKQAFKNFIDAWNNKWVPPDDDYILSANEDLPKPSKTVVPAKKVLLRK